MDHAAYTASVELAPGKARTAALFKKPSQALEDAINHGRTAAVTAPGFVEMQGGLPIVVDGEVIGAIGTPEHDVQIAQAPWRRSLVESIKRSSPMLHSRTSSEANRSRYGDGPKNQDGMKHGQHTVK